MAGQGNGVLDPRLGPPTSNSSPSIAYASARPHAQSYSGPPHDQPYYHYPTPTSHTPQQSNIHALSASSQSNQASPHHDEFVSQDHQTAASPGEYADHDAADDAKRPRACEACRGLKVRCDQDPLHPEIPCKRCAKAGRQCIITQPNRKRQKKSDSRVAELEKKLDALTAVLNQQGASNQYATPQGSGVGGLPPADMQPDRPGAMHSLPYAQQSSGGTNASPLSGSSLQSQGLSMQPPQKRRRIEETESLDGAGVSSRDVISQYTSSAPTKSENEIREEIRQMNDYWGPNSGDLKGLLHPSTSPEEFVKRINSLISPDMASTIFTRYMTRLMPHLPAVVFAPGTTAEQVWKERPILYVCVLSATSAGTLHPEISKQLAREAVGAIADCVVRNGAKSLELIQAMQVMALWYKPPEKAEQTNFYQVIHMAAVMALDIGLGKRFNPVKARRGFGGPHSHCAPGPGFSPPQDSDTLEARRAWLCCYYLCASASMVLRRPNLIRWTNYMKECLEVLESHPDAYPSDKLFCQHVKIQHICEDIGLQFLMDDSSANVSITDPKVSYQLRVLENDLKKWKEDIPTECRGPELEFFEHVTSLYLHEIALHFNHNVEDFRLPFTEESLKSVNNTSDTLTQNQMAALEACFRASHGILDTMLSFELQVIKSLPMLIFFVRCTYAIVILIKMHVAISTPGSEMGKIMKADALRVDHYLDSLIAMFGYVTNAEEPRPYPKILRILGRLKSWFDRHKENVAAQALGERAPSMSTSLAEAPLVNSYRQTPLDLLSQAASTKLLPQQPAAAGSRGEGQSDWTFSSPYTFDYSRPPPPGHPDTQFPLYQQQEPGNQQQMSDLSNAEQGMPIGVDPSEYGWGSGFEQAMDMAMGGMDSLPAGGLDGWFLGDSMAPFAFSGDVGSQQWQ